MSRRETVGIGEVVRCILGKAIFTVTGPDVQQVTEALQLCAGQQVGCEAAIHAMRHLFTEPNTEAVLLVDAANAFIIARMPCRTPSISVHQSPPH